MEEVTLSENTQIDQRHERSSGFKILEILEPGSDV